MTDLSEYLLGDEVHAPVLRAQVNLPLQPRGLPHDDAARDARVRMVGPAPRRARRARTRGRRRPRPARSRCRTRAFTVIRRARHSTRASNSGSSSDYCCSVPLPTATRPWAAAGASGRKPTFDCNKGVGGEGSDDDSGSHAAGRWRRRRRRAWRGPASLGGAAAASTPPRCCCSYFARSASRTARSGLKRGAPRWPPLGPPTTAAGRPRGQQGLRWRPRRECPAAAAAAGGPRRRRLPPPVPLLPLPLTLALLTTLTLAASRTTRQD